MEENSYYLEDKENQRFSEVGEAAGRVRELEEKLPQNFFKKICSYIVLFTPETERLYTLNSEPHEEFSQNSQKLILVSNEKSSLQNKVFIFSSEIERLNIELKHDSGNTAIIHEYEEKIVMLTSEIEMRKDFLMQYREDNNIVQSQMTKESRMTIEQQLALARLDAE